MDAEERDQRRTEFAAERERLRARVTETYLTDLIWAERQRQDEKWGTQHHDPAWWLVVLMEEVGEAAQAALKARARAGHGYSDGALLEDYRHEMVQVAAVAVAALECLERDAWTWGGLTVNREDG